MRSFYVGGHGRSVVQTEQAVIIVDQHVKLAQKVLAEDTAKVEIDGMGILEVKHEYLLVGQSWTARRNIVIES
jgi:hypothetical protein